MTAAQLFFFSGAVSLIFEIALFNFNVEKVALLSQRSISIALYDLGVGQRLQLLRSDQAIAVQG